LVRCLTFRLGRILIEIMNKLFENRGQAALLIPIDKEKTSISISARFDVLMSDTTADGQDGFLIREIRSEGDFDE
jgi:hypothetical protein